MKPANIVPPFPPPDTLLGPGELDLTRQAELLRAYPRDGSFDLRVPGVSVARIPCSST